ncbi:hypothetical protein BDV93DRAFT_566614 [Ceratobasidium sp. AG-I]|nr:hypothetical protein BDV93DRAFT_566614 [Ceratobasidium sp. AG-I]
MARAETPCLVHECVLPDIPRPFLFRRIFRRGRPYKSQVQAACQFVANNYRLGDSVMLFGWLLADTLGDPRYVALQQLAKALDEGFYADVSGSNAAGSKISAKTPQVPERSGAGDCSGSRRS